MAGTEECVAGVSWGIDRWLQVLIYRGPVRRMGGKCHSVNLMSCLFSQECYCNLALPENCLGWNCLVKAGKRWVSNVNCILMDLVRFVICFGISILVALRTHVNVLINSFELKMVNKQTWSKDLLTGICGIILLDGSSETILVLQWVEKSPNSASLWGWGIWDSEKLVYTLR